MPLRLPATFKPTHNTDGLDGYPAKDVFGKPGTAVLAPASGTLVNTHFINWNSKQRVGGWTTYLVTAKGVYFLTHLGGSLPSGTQVKAGQKIGTVGAVPGNLWEPHIHEGFHTGADSRVGSESVPPPETPAAPTPSDQGQPNYAALQQSLAIDSSNVGGVPLVTPPTVESPSQGLNDPKVLADTWQLIAAQPGASPDAVRLAQLAGSAYGQ